MPRLSPFNVSVYHFSNYLDIKFLLNLIPDISTFAVPVVDNAG